MTDPAQSSFPKLRGIVPPLATPLLDLDHLDLEGTAKLVEHVLSGGVHGLFLLGTTGEGPSLAHDLQHKFVEIVCDQVAARVPVLVGVSDPSLSESLSLATTAHSAGAAAIVVAPPFYFPTSQSEVLYHLKSLADASPLPVVLYNMPSCVKVPIGLEILRDCLQHSNIVGLKDSSGDLDYFEQALSIARQRDDFSVLIGPEERLWEAMRMGVDGGVSGGANLEPQTYVGLYEAARNSDTAAAELHHQRILRISELIYGVESENSRFIKGIKATLANMGICSDFVLPPFEPIGEPTRGTIRENLQQLGIPTSDIRTSS